MARPTIGLDLDDVLMEFNGALCLFHNAHYGTSLTKEDVVSYNLEEIWGCDRDEAIRRVNEFYLSEEHDMAESVRGSIDVVGALQERAELYVVTSRPERVREETLRWLGKNFPKLADRVYFATHSPFFHIEGNMTKGQVCRELGVDLFVDDAPHYVDDVASHVGSVLLYDAPWNRTHRSEHMNVRRVHSWIEIRNALRK